MNRDKQVVGLRVLNDAAIGDVPSPDRTIRERDVLNTSAYADLLVEVIRSTDAPQVIAILGDWGAGKTSLMQILRESLDEQQTSCVTAWFNTWLHENDASLLLSMADELHKQIKGRPGFLERAGEAAKSALKFLGDILRTVKVSGDVILPGLGKTNLTVDLAKLPGDAHSKDGDKIPLPAAINEAFSKISLSAGQRVVVFLDDLDRCRPDRALEILENLKLVFPHAGFAFVLGIANNELEKYLRHLHKKEYGIEDYDGRMYFEKLIQMNFPVPRLDDEQAETFAKFLTGDAAGGLGAVAPIVRIAGRNNPRAMKRFANGVLLDYHLASVRESTRSHSIEVGLLAVARALRENWQQEYRVALGNEDQCKPAREYVEDRSKPVPDNLDPYPLLKSLLSDPDLAYVMGTPAGRKWLHSTDRHRDIERWVRPVAVQREIRKRYDVYISYRWHDRDRAAAIASHLGKQGLSVMWDGRLQVGMNWRQFLDAGMRDSRAMLFLISKEQQAGDPVVSDPQMKEAELALQLAAEDPAFLLVPVLLYGASSSRHCPVALRDFYWIGGDGETDEMDMTRLDEYLKGITDVLKGEAPAP